MGESQQGESLCFLQQGIAVSSIPRPSDRCVWVAPGKEERDCAVSLGVRGIED